MNRSVLLMLFALGVVFFACVPQRKLEDEKNRSSLLQKQRDDCREDLKAAEAAKKQLEQDLTVARENIERLKTDTTRQGEQQRKLQKMYVDIEELYDKIVEQNRDLLSTSASERQRLSLELAERQRELEAERKKLQDKENSLNQLSATITDKEKKNSELLKELQEREKKVKDLESLIARQDSAVNALRQNIADALLSFDKSELTVEMRDGKVYVSLAEKLLFKSGSAVVDAKGKDALKKLAQVLARQTDIDIMVEGHTDNVPISTAAIKDNWDLSVLRATSIVRILTEGNLVAPERVIPSGRGEFLPVEPNDKPEGRAKNRRTEIILSPKLDKVFELLNKS